MINKNEELPVLRIILWRIPERDRILDWSAADAIYWIGISERQLKMNKSMFSLTTKILNRFGRFLCPLTADNH